jgi:hypothetical protein
MMLFGLPEMKVFAETSSDPRIKALWARLEEARRKNALWCEEVNTLRNQLRWRKWPDEEPKESGQYLLLDCRGLAEVNYLMIGDDASEGEWVPFPDQLRYWRPIGELPGE